MHCNPLFWKQPKKKNFHKETLASQCKTHFSVSLPFLFSFHSCRRYNTFLCMSFGERYPTESRDQKGRLSRLAAERGWLVVHSLRRVLFSSFISRMREFMRQGQHLHGHGRNHRHRHDLPSGRSRHGHHDRRRSCRGHAGCHPAGSHHGHLGSPAAGGYLRGRRCGAPRSRTSPRRSGRGWRRWRPCSPRGS